MSDTEDMAQDPDDLLPQPTVQVTDQIVVQLAMSLASKLTSTHEVLDSLGLSTDQFKEVVKSDYFKRVFADAKAAWGSSGNSTERIRAKGNMLIEDVMLDLYTRVKSPLTADSDVVKLVNTIAQLSNMAPPVNQQAGGGAQFTVTINLQNSAPSKLTGTIIDQPQQPVIDVDSTGTSNG